MPPFLNGALLCDAARDYSGRVSILGAFVNVVMVRELPIPAPVYYACRIGFPHDELGPHSVVIRVRDPDDEVVAEVIGQTGPVMVEARVAPELPDALQIAIPLPFPINQLGLHWVDLVVDGVVLNSLQLVVMAPPAGVT